MSRAKRRSKEERAEVLRSIKRNRDGTAKAGSVKHAARKAGVSPTTIYGWITRDGWPDTDRGGRPSLAAAKPPLASDLQALASEQEPHVIGEVVPLVVAPAPESNGQAAALLHVNRGLSYRAIGERLGVHGDTVRRWLTKPGPVRDYVEELRAVQRQATAEYVAEVAHYGAKAAAGAARIAAQMTDDALEATGDEALSPEEVERLEAVNRLQANAIGGVKALSSTFAKAWEAADIGAINTTRTEAEASTPASKARDLAEKLAEQG